jgi:hypothetical protein
MNENYGGPYIAGGVENVGCGVGSPTDQEIKRLREENERLWKLARSVYELASSALITRIKLEAIVASLETNLPEWVD